MTNVLRRETHKEIREEDEMEVEVGRMQPQGGTPGGSRNGGSTALLTP